MDFDALPIIPAGNIYRAAMVSADRGERVLNELVQKRQINPVVTPTGRTLLSPRDGKRAFEAIRNIA